MNAALASLRRLRVLESPLAPGPFRNRLVPGDTVNLRLLNDVLRHRIELIGFENAAAATVAKALLGVKRNLLQQVAAIHARGGAEFDRSSALGVMRLVDAELAFLRSTIPASLAAQADALARDEARMMTEIAQDAVAAKAPDAELPFRTPEPEPRPARIVLGHDVEAIFGKLADDVSYRVGGLLGQAAQGAAPWGETIDALKAELDGTGIRAETLARTVVAGAANDASREWMAENADILEGWVWLATLDTRTCLRCGDLDGEVFGPEDKAPPIPLHWNCRCAPAPALKSAEELGLGADLPEGQRAAMNGEVPESVGWQEWIEAQPKEDQIEALGQGRYDAWKAGRLTLGSFVSRTRILTLDDLRRRHPRAFPT